MSVKPWFRMYHEFATDPVVQSLAFEDQRHFVVLLCLKCSSLLDRQFPTQEVRNRTICAALGLDPVAGAEVSRRLREYGLIDADWQPTNWAKRQYESDNSTERVRKWRSKSSPTPPPEEESQKQKQIQSGNVTCNVSETFHESLPDDAWAEWIAHRKSRRWPCDQTTLKKQLSLLAKHDTATQREIIDNSIQAGWQGLFPPKGSSKPRPTRYEQLMQRVDLPATSSNPFLIEGKI